MKAKLIFTDVLDIILLIIVTFFTFSIIDRLFDNLNMKKLLVIFVMLINNFIIGNISKSFTTNNFNDNILLVIFITTLLCISYISIVKSDYKLDIYKIFNMHINEYIK